MFIGIPLQAELAALAELAELANRLATLSAQGRDQSVYQSRDFPSLIHQFFQLLFIEVTKIACQFKLGLHLVE
jgi:type II secretory pathway component GspD/PulD (secretin)